MSFQTFTTFIIPCLGIVLYLIAGVGNMVCKNNPMALMWIAYAIANSGIAWAAFNNLQK